MLDTMIVGRRILTQDGEDIGQVKEIEGRFFKIDAPMRTDYWLNESCIESTTGDAVHLNIPGHLVGDYMLSGPHDREAGEHVATETTSTTVTVGPDAMTQS